MNHLIIISCVPPGLPALRDLGGAGLPGGVCGRQGLNSTTLWPDCRLAEAGYPVWYRQSSLGLGCPPAWDFRPSHCEVTEGGC